MLALKQESANKAEPESQIAMILEYRYGDGQVYLPRHKPSAFFTEARTRGFIDDEGYVTRKGRALIARYRFL